MPLYRCTFPKSYRGTPAATDPSARCGHFVAAESPAAARERARQAVDAADPDEPVDVQEWPGGALVDDQPVLVSMTTTEAQQLLVQLALARAYVEQVAKTFRDSHARDLLPQIDRSQAIVGRSLASAPPAAAPALTPTPARTPLPESLRKQMDMWRSGLGEPEMPPAYVAFHRRLAERRTRDLQIAGCEVKEVDQRSDGWGDGMTVAHLHVQTASGRSVRLVWNDSAQEFFVVMPSGGSAVVTPSAVR